jgi:hypothetical protein
VYRSFRLRPRTRRRLAWLAMVMLLWQQVAVAAYACAVAPEAARAAAVASATVMGTMAMDGAHCDRAHDTQPAPLCEKHCLPDHFTQVDATTVSVPFLTVPIVFPPITAAAIGDRGAGRFDLVDRRRPTPSPLQLYGVLLI